MSGKLHYFFWMHDLIFSIVCQLAEVAVILLTFYMTSIKNISIGNVYQTITSTNVN